MNKINISVPKIDSTALLDGKPVYTADFVTNDALIVKVLRSPHAHAKITNIDISEAAVIEGVECILTHDDVPKNRFTLAGQSYPEPSPYDRYILEDTVRYVGDPVVIVAATSNKIADQALEKIKVEYKLLDAILSVDEALDNEIIIHSEEDYHVNFDVGNDRMRNLVSSGNSIHGDVDADFANCDIVLEDTFLTKANAQMPFETFRTFTKFDHNDRLVVISSTQVPFHVRRTTAKALGLPSSKVKVVKPRIGGGFGAKQCLVSELFPAIVTMKTGKPAYIEYTRKESFIASNSRHEMKINVKVGANNDGKIVAIKINTLSNAGAYAEQSTTTVGLTAEKTIPLYTPKSFKFEYDVVYTNTMPGGAFRGYGATQGCFALETMINRVAEQLNIDPIDIRLKNIPQEGDILHAYHGEKLNSTTLRELLEHGRKISNWDEKYPTVRVNDEIVRSMGLAISMQGSSISNIDVAGARINLGDDNFYNLHIGATDMGTGCDTILAQMASEILQCNLSQIIVHSVDTDVSPFDTGSYASSTTYLTGTAVVKATEELLSQMKIAAQSILNEDIIDFNGKYFYGETSKLSLQDLAIKHVLSENCANLEGMHSEKSLASPPPFMVGIVETEINKITGELKIINYYGLVDCGTVINKSLAKVQVEGGIVQGIGMALYEDITYSGKGAMLNNSLMTYKIPSRIEIGNVEVDFISSYEPTGPFGAKSVGEIVINTPSPAIAHAVKNATGHTIKVLPITNEKIALGENIEL